MTTFKNNDIVRCIRTSSSGSYLTEGRLYVVDKTPYSGDVTLKEDNRGHAGGLQTWFSNRFELVTPTPARADSLKAGDLVVRIDGAGGNVFQFKVGDIGVVERPSSMGMVYVKSRAGVTVELYAKRFMLLHRPGSVANQATLAPAPVPATEPVVFNVGDYVEVISGSYAGRKGHIETTVTPQVPNSILGVRLDNGNLNRHYARALKLISRAAPELQQIDFKTLKVGDKVTATVVLEVIEPVDSDGDVRFRTADLGMNEQSSHSLYIGNRKALKGAVEKALVPIKVGDKVTLKEGTTVYTVLGIDTGKAWLKDTGGYFSTFQVASLIHAA